MHDDREPFKPYFFSLKTLWIRNFVIEGVACQRRLQATPPLQTSLEETLYMQTNYGAKLHSSMSKMNNTPVEDLYKFLVVAFKRP